MKFVAFERSNQGTGASRRLRTAGRTPAIVYGGAATPTKIEINHNDLFHALKKEAFHASILEMELAGKTSRVLLRDVQYHPFKPQVLHCDFQRVEEKTVLHMRVPLHFSGEELSTAVKFDGCLVNHVVTEIEISCLPADLPEYISVDLSQLKKGGSLHLDDMQLPKGVKAVTHGKTNPVIVSVVSPAAEEESAAAAATQAAPAAATPPAEEKKASAKK